MRIILTCYDTKIKKWIWPLDSHQTSSSMPISEAFEKESDHPKELEFASGERYKFFVKVHE